MNARHPLDPFLSSPSSFNLFACTQHTYRYRQTVGEKHRSYAATLNNLGLLFLSQAQQAQGKMEAQEYLMRYVDVCGGRGDERDYIYKRKDCARPYTYLFFAPFINIGQKRHYVRS